MSAPTLSSVVKKLEKLERHHEKLQEKFLQLFTTHKTTKAKLTELKTSHQQLKSEHTKLESQHTKLQAQNEKLKAQNEKLKAQNEELKRRLKLDSKTSSEPPSSDGLKKKNRTSSQRKKGKRTSGGQKGHKGNSLKQFKNAHQTLLLPLPHCPYCNFCRMYFVALNPCSRGITRFIKMAS